MNTPGRLSPAAYRAFAHALQESARRLLELADGDTPHERAARTRVINATSRKAREFFQRNAGLQKNNLRQQSDTF